MVFDYQSRLWEVGLDGSGLTEIGANFADDLSAPVYSPSGTQLLFLGQQSRWDPILYLLDLQTGKWVSFDIRPNLGDNLVPRAPLSWLEPQGR